MTESEGSGSDRPADLPDATTSAEPPASPASPDLTAAAAAAPETPASDTPDTLAPDAGESAEAAAEPPAAESPAAEPAWEPPAAPPVAASPWAQPGADEVATPPAYGATPAYGTPPPTYAPPPSMPVPPVAAAEGSSAWIGAPPQAAPKRSTASRVVGAIGVLIGVAVLLVVVAGFAGILPSDKGKVLFGTAAGSNLCSVGGQTATITTTDPVFFAAILKHHMDGDQAITFKITKDGTEFVTHEEPADGTSFDCYGNKESLGTLEAGTYVFSVLHGNDLEATGTLTVK